MRLLQRQAIGPTCLANYHHGQHQWTGESPKSAERADIWALLNSMQREMCAYCECRLKLDDRHIEHFRQRSRYPQGTFDWTNLFGSCCRSGTCGSRKDKCGTYPPGDLLKPDVDNPDDFLVFDAEGGVSARANLGVQQKHRADETIRILGLRKGGLPQMRKVAAKGYLHHLEDWQALADSCPEEEWRPLVEEDLAEQLLATADQPFATAIRHTLCSIP
ncbi:TIGR02646 family protein [Xylophilus sp. Kf1]|nr:TIGR02646 family protein [Xylophilus sp. Kf1]